MADRIGADHVALGSGFDAPVSIPIDSAGMVVLTGALLDAGFSEAEVRGIMGANMLRLFLRALPEDS